MGTLCFCKQKHLSSLLQNVIEFCLQLFESLDVAVNFTFLCLYFVSEETCNPGEKFNPLTESCDPCEIGTYQSVSDSLVEQCEPCGPALSTRTTGAVSQSQCEGKALKTV